MKRQYGAPLVVPTIDGERKAICTPGQKQCLDRCLPVIKEILAAHLSRWDDALAMSIALAGCLPPWVTSEKDPGARKAIQCLQAEIRRLREAAAKIREAWDALPPGVQGGLPVNIRPTHFPSEDRDPLDDVLAFAADTESAVTAALKRWPRNPRGAPANPQTDLHLHLWSLLAPWCDSERLGSRIIAALLVRLEAVAPSTDPDRLAESIRQTILEYRKAHATVPRW